MRYGRSVDPGFLPVYSVDTVREARELLTAACSTNLDGEFIADELAAEQTLHNLYEFGRRLERVHKRIIEKKRP